MGVPRNVLCLRRAHSRRGCKLLQNSAIRGLKVKTFVPPDLTYRKSTFCPRCVFFYASKNRQRLFPCTTLTDWVLGAFANLLKTTFSFILSLCLSVRPSVRMEQLGFHWTEFDETSYFSVLRKSIEKNPSLIKIRQK